MNNFGLLPIFHFLLSVCLQLMNKKALLIHSTPGTDQTPLIKQLINYIQQQRQQEGDECEVVKVPLYSGFSRDSLISLLHDKSECS